MNRLCVLVTMMFACSSASDSEVVGGDFIAFQSTAACGEFAFSSAVFALPEHDAFGLGAVVTRTGGLSGAATLVVETNDGSALAGLAYQATTATVQFDDGDATPRIVPIPFIDDKVVESDETIHLTLTLTAGCGAVGPISQAVMRIVDDDRTLPPPAPSYSIGGTVVGLVGSGLVVSHLGETITPSNGPFVFSQRVLDAFPYHVQVAAQPAGQLCVVTGGMGVIAGSDVTDVTVTCADVVDSPLDASFGEAGLVMTPNAGRLHDMVVAPDGKIITVGRVANGARFDFIVIRYKSDGDLDNTFAGTGIVKTPFPGGKNDEANAVAIQPDGKIVVAGYSVNGTNYDFALARYLDNGELDATFDTDGMVTTDFAGDVDQANAITLQSDGKIVVAGHARALLQNNDFAVARYNDNGSLDESFGGDGKVTTTVVGESDLANAVAMLASQRIVVAGRVAEDGGASPDFGLVCYEVNGDLCAGFGTGGLQIIDAGGFDIPESIIVQPGDDIVLVGRGASEGVADVALVRCNSAGERDNDFGTEGIVHASPGTGADYGVAATRQADGTIVVAAQASSDTTYDLSLLRFDANGVPSATTTADLRGGSDEPKAIALQPDGSVIAAGNAENGTAFGPFIARFLP